MKVALIGASGFVGKAILTELISRDQHVTAIVRNPEQLKETEQVQVVKADALNAGEISKAVAGHDAVISAYNSGWTNPNIYNEFLQGAAAIQEGVKKSGVKRLLVIGGAGSLFVAEGLQAVDTPQFPEAFKGGATAARDYLKELKKEKELEWTFLSPALEMHAGTSGERKGTYREGLENPVFNNDSRSIISVEDTAVAIVDELEKPKHIRERFTVAY